MPGKETFRKEILNRLKSTEREAFILEGLKGAALLRSSSLWSGCQTLFVFLSMNTEIDTMPVIKAAFEDGKKVFAPKADLKDSGELVFCQVFSPDGPWKKGAFGILEPEDHECIQADPDCTIMQKNIITHAELDNFPVLILTPGLAFDREGNRLGRGKGYYDRFFDKLDKENKRYMAIGFCMDFQLEKKVPAGDYDKKVHGVLTGKNFCFFRKI